MIEGFVAAATVPGIEGETIDLGSGTLVPMGDIVDRLVRIVGKDIKPEFGVLPARSGENAIAGNTLIAAQRLGWRARTSLDDGLRQTIDWYRSVQRVASFAPAVTSLRPR